ncbi:hypothetical protein SAMN04487866_10172 [Thermoactinomyces sp. DSM 45891]|nr:hypothetical protein [Thermoactinomyces sp. DSM 45891]SFW98693.1 hypothetical protein SAMN04487866_10172 [Thermoactinomyces sp. DSM 45891]
MNKIIHGDCLDVLKTLPDNSVDTALTDPPYSVLVNHFITTSDKWKRK